MAVTAPLVIKRKLEELELEEQGNPAAIETTKNNGNDINYSGSLYSAKLSTNLRQLDRCGVQKD